MAAESRIAIYAAIAGNLAIAITKFVAFGMSGSSSMLSEGFHSTVDTGNQLLLLLGLWSAKRAPSRQHPFGYGLDLYFWSLIVAIVIFGVGGGVSIYEGVLHVSAPEPITSATTVFVVLGISAVFESISLGFAIRGVLRLKGRRSVWEMIRTTKDPSSITVLLEDSAALVGLALAAAAIGAGELLDMPALDGVGSIAIGCVLAGVAVLLGRECRSLLLGESAGNALVEDVRRMAERDPLICKVAQPLTMHFGPENVLVTLDLQIDSTVKTEELAGALDRLEASIHERYPEIRRVYFRVQ